MSEVIKITERPNIPEMRAALIEMSKVINSFTASTTIEAHYSEPAKFIRTESKFSLYLPTQI